MKNKTQLLAIILLTTSSNLLGQEINSPRTRKSNIQEISIQTGWLSELNTNPTLSDFKSLAPQSMLLNKDFSDYYSSGYILNGNPMVSLMLGINLNQKNKPTNKSNPLVKIGFSYFSGTTLTASLFKYDQTTYDSLTSTRTGQTILFDSISSKTYRMNYSSNQIRFDGSFIFRTNTKKRWSVFTGIGITIGVSINAHTDILSVKSEETEAHLAGETLSHSNLNSSLYIYNRETFRNKNNITASTYIPLGIDFRIANKKSFWKQMHLFYEFRPGLNMVSIPELRTITNVSFQQGIGIKYSWN